MIIYIKNKYNNKFKTYYKKFHVDTKSNGQVIKILKLILTYNVYKGNNCVVTENNKY